MSREVHVVRHPLVQHKLTLMRRKKTSTSQFRQLLEEISMLLAYGADKSSRNIDRLRSFTIAKINGNEEAAALLA
jgi:uracil phosphoribosyltransferase